MDVVGMGGIISGWVLAESKDRLTGGSYIAWETSRPVGLSRATQPADIVGRGEGVEQS